MKNNKVIKIGTRGSQLALIQTEMIEKRLAALGCRTEKIIIKTTGDQILDKPLSEFGGKAVFVLEFERLIQNGTIDIAVHSAKDMPTVLGEGLCIGACLERADVRDVLVTLKNTDRNHIAKIATGSLRRQCQAKEIYPNAVFVPIRGNVPTRLNRLTEHPFDALILAAAGIRRLGLDTDERFHFEALDTDRFVPAAAQGIIAAETKADSEVFHLLREINDYHSLIALETEREWMKEINADCHQAVGAYASLHGDHITLTVMKYQNDKCVYLSDTAKIAEHSLLAKSLAQKMLKD